MKWLETVRVDVTKVYSGEGTICEGKSLLHMNRLNGGEKYSVPGIGAESLAIFKDNR
ncbi:hypothetical protein [Paenibacillus lentus]|uniref:hypothetical protein n=1 Tax=Paenibacillus lentus TaxID=1338368 RepID=UPI0013DE18C6|nr:hypothetical protein [Paenibacillus lentus]